MRYAVVIEKTGKGYSGYVPDLPGCVATAKTVAELETRLRTAIDLHISGLKEDGEAVPEATSIVEYVDA